VTAKDRILVLRVFKHGESDLIVHGLNPLGARLSFFVRGGAKSQKRFAGGILQPTHFLDVLYKPGRRSDQEALHSLLEAKLIREFLGLRSDYDRLESALHILKVVHKLSQAGVEDSSELFNLLGNALAAAETSQDLIKLKLHFELKLLANQGVLPGDNRFMPWLTLSLSEHGKISDSREDRRWVESQVHGHLHQYLGR
jgi:DNA repair protein RecO (recombination protein O)